MVGASAARGLLDRRRCAPRDTFPGVTGKHAEKKTKVDGHWRGPARMGCPYTAEQGRRAREGGSQCLRSSALLVCVCFRFRLLFKAIKRSTELEMHES